MQFRLRTLLIVLVVGPVVLVLFGWLAKVNWSRPQTSPTATVSAHRYQSRMLLHAEVLGNMPMNSGLRCMGISLVSEALLDGEVFDADDCDTADNIGQQILSNAHTKQTIRFSSLVCWDGTKAPVQSRKALTKLSDVVADLYKRMHDEMAATESGRLKLESAMAPLVADVADLDTLLDTDRDNLLAFCAIGVREFPDGTSKDAYHVVLVGRDESGQKVIYDSNDPGRPIPCVLTADSDGLRVVWTCLFRHTEQFTTQECRLVPTEAFFRVALERE
jgi:hypothetical protein